MLYRVRTSPIKNSPVASTTLQIWCLEYSGIRLCEHSRWILNTPTPPRETGSFSLDSNGVTAEVFDRVYLSYELVILFSWLLTTDTVETCLFSTTHRNHLNRWFSQHRYEDRHIPMPHSNKIMYILREYFRRRYREGILSSRNKNRRDQEWLTNVQYLRHKYKPTQYKNLIVSCL